MASSGGNGRSLSLRSEGSSGNGGGTSATGSTGVNAGTQSQASGAGTLSSSSQIAMAQGSSETGTFAASAGEGALASTGAGTALAAAKKAADRFASYIRQNSNSQEFQKLSLYYKGYAEYNLAEFKNAYSSFVRYCMETQNEAALCGRIKGKIGGHDNG